VRIKLYVVPGSNPSMSARLALEHKRLDYERVDLLPTIHMAFLRLAGFPGRTVPALRADGRRIQGSLEIARALEQLRPDPPLFPTDPEERQRVEEAERWGEAVFQPVPRRLAWWAINRDRRALRSFAAGARLHVPLGLAIRGAGPIVRWEIRTHEATNQRVRADLGALSEALDMIDAWIQDAVIGGRRPNAADFQIAPSVRLLMCAEQLRPLITERPCGRLAERLVPTFPGRIGPVFPTPWLPG
jgi:glutathione S-transferase